MPAKHGPAFQFFNMPQDVGPVLTSLAQQLRLTAFSRFLGHHSLVIPYETGKRAVDSRVCACLRLTGSTLP